MIKVSDIGSVDWSPKLGSLGDVVEQLQDIEQCIRIIVLSPKGSDPHRPDFGCDAWRYLDRPADTGFADIIREVIQAIRAWEPRVLDVSLTCALNGSQVTLTINWTLNVQGSVVQMTTDLGLAKGA